MSFKDIFLPFCISSSISSSSVNSLTESSSNPRKLSIFIFNFASCSSIFIKCIRISLFTLTFILLYCSKLNKRFCKRFKNCIQRCFTSAPLQYLSPSPSHHQTDGVAEGAGGRGRFGFERHEFNKSMSHLITFALHIKIL